MTTRFKSLAHGMQMPWVTLTLTAAMLIAHVIPGAFETLVYDRTAVQGGDFWRLATGHLVHLDGSHLAANVAAFLGLGWLIETTPRTGRATLLKLLALGGGAIGAMLLAVSNTTLGYAGLSGVLNALFAYVCLELFTRTRHKAWLALVAGAGAKIAWEAAFGPLFTTELAWPSHTWAHLTGLATGVACAVARAVRSARSSWYFPWSYCPLTPA